MDQRKIVSVILMLQIIFLAAPFWMSGKAGMIWGAIAYHVHTHYHNHLASHVALHMAITHIMIYTLAGSGFGPIGALAGFLIGIA